MEAPALAPGGDAGEPVVGDADTGGVGLDFVVHTGEAAAFLELLQAEKPGFPENAVMVTHGMTIRLFLMRWFHYTVEEFETLANPSNCGIVVLERQENGRYLLKTEMRRHEVEHSWRLVN